MSHWASAGYMRPRQDTPSPSVPGEALGESKVESDLVTPEEQHERVDRSRPATRHAAWSLRKGHLTNQQTLG